MESLFTVFLVITLTPMAVFAQSQIESFSDEELKVLSADIISMYHDSRRGIVDFKTSLEQFSLSL